MVILADPVLRFARPSSVVVLTREGEIHSKASPVALATLTIDIKTSGVSGITAVNVRVRMRIIADDGRGTLIPPFLFYLCISGVNVWMRFS